MILYHLSTDLTHNGIFTPNIPTIRMDGEDDRIKRVSTSASIGGCLSGIPDGGMRLDKLVVDQHGYFKCFIIDTDKLGITDYVLTSQQLFEYGLVEDAETTDEHWILTPFTVPDEDSQLIHIDNWHEDMVDQIPHVIYELADKLYEGDYFEAYNDLIGDRIPCTTQITNVTYTPAYINDFHRYDVDDGAEELDAIMKKHGLSSYIDSKNRCVIPCRTNLTHVWLEHFDTLKEK